MKTSEAIYAILNDFIKRIKDPLIKSSKRLVNNKKIQIQKLGCDTFFLGHICNES